MIVSGSVVASDEGKTFAGGHGVPVKYGFHLSVLVTLHRPLMSDQFILHFLCKKYC